MREVAGILLAAGASRRMGQNKMLLHLDGESVLRRATRRALDASLSPVVVVLGHDRARAEGELAGLGVDIALSPDYFGPTGGSVRAGFERLDPSVAAAVVMLADMPYVTAAMLRALVSTGAPLAVSRYGDVLAPPILFSRERADDVIARRLGGAVFVDWPAAALADIDTPDDLRRVQTCLR